MISSLRHWETPPTEVIKERIHRSQMSTIPLLMTHLRWITSILRTGTVLAVILAEGFINLKLLIGKDLHRWVTMSQDLMRSSNSTVENHSRSFSSWMILWGSISLSRKNCKGRFPRWLLSSSRLSRSHHRLLLNCSSKFNLWTRNIRRLWLHGKRRFFMQKESIDRKNK